MTKDERHSSLQLRDPGSARRFLLQGLLLSRATRLTPDRVDVSLQVAKELAGQGFALPPLGFIVDLVEMVTSHYQGAESSELPLPGDIDPSVIRRYEDHVLGKLIADRSFQRGSEAVWPYSGRDRQRAIAYLISRLGERARLEGVELSPSVIGGLAKLPPASVLQQAWDSVSETGLDRQLVESIEQLTERVRNSGVCLGPEDLFELESGIALAAFGQRIAIRQVLQTEERLRGTLPTQRPRNSSRKYTLATNLKQEDSYPIGGFSSISNRGTMESLVRSELAYMEDGERPDVFDIKYARNELLYYSRDENQFLRRKLCFVFALSSDLVSARVKEGQLPVQAVVVLLASLCLAVRQLLDWLSNDSIEFEFLWLEEEGQPPQLQQERELIETLLQESIALGIVHQQNLSTEELAEHLQARVRHSFCQSLVLAWESPGIEERDLPPNSTLAITRYWDWNQWNDQVQQWMQTWCV
ncbi:MAG: hypothetical protein AAGG48_03420 [Planctomycetota bacterium]